MAFLFIVSIIYGFSAEVMVSPSCEQHILIDESSPKEHSVRGAMGSESRTIYLKSEPSELGKRLLKRYGVSIAQKGRTKRNLGAMPILVPFAPTEFSKVGNVQLGNQPVMIWQWQLVHQSAERFGVYDQIKGKDITKPVEGVGFRREGEPTIYEFMDTINSLAEDHSPVLKQLFADHQPHHRYVIPGYKDYKEFIGLEHAKERKSFHKDGQKWWFVEGKEKGARIESPTSHFREWGRPESIHIHPFNREVVSLRSLYSQSSPNLITGSFHTVNQDSVHTAPTHLRLRRVNHRP